MNKKQKIKVLNYAIESINRYDEHIENGSRYVGDCDMCELIPRKLGSHGFKTIDCSECPFSKGTLCCSDLKKPYDQVGADARDKGKQLKLWQNELIKRLNRWCKKFDVGFVVEKKE